MPVNPAGILGVVTSPEVRAEQRDVGGSSLDSRFVPLEQSREDTDVGWGEYPEEGDERLYRDRPPHWDDV